jgi:hypothetical protein
MLISYRKTEHVVVVATELPITNFESKFIEFTLYYCFPIIIADHGEINRQH